MPATQYIEDPDTLDPYGYEPDDDEQDDRYDNPDPDTQIAQGGPIVAGTPAAPSGGVQYVAPLDYGGADVDTGTPQTSLPPTTNPPPDAYMPLGAPPQKLGVLQRIVQLATQHPGSQPSTSDGTVPAYPDALKGLAKIYDQYPQRQAPNWLERVGAALVGGAAGESNAARRAAPINIPQVTEGILYPGYESKLAAWQSRVVPAQQAVQLAGEQVAAQRAGELNAANIGLKGAQTQMNLERGQFYIGQQNRGMVQVTPAMEQATGGQLKAGTTVATATVDAALNDAIKANPSTAMQQKVDNLRKIFPQKSDDEIWQAIVNPSEVGKPAPVKVPTEAQTRDEQIKADFASALGRDPSTVTAAEMNSARRMFGTGDPLITSSIRAFIAQNSRLPTPVEEHRLVSQAVDQRANARIPASQLPPAAPKPEVFSQIEKDKGNMFQAAAERLAKAKAAGSDTADQDYARDMALAQSIYETRIREVNNSGGSVAPAPARPTVPVAPPPGTGAAGPAAPVAAPAQTRLPGVPGATGQTAPQGSGPIHVTLPGGKVKVFPNQQALDDFSKASGLTFTKAQ